MDNEQVIDSFCELAPLRPTVKDLPMHTVSTRSELHVPLTINGINKLSIIDFNSRP
jgi:hypothetical protein